MTNLTPPSRHDEATAVRAHAERLGLPGLIDVHTHFMPQNVLDKVWAYFDAIDTPAGEWTITYRTDEAERVAWQELRVAQLRERSRHFLDLISETA